MDLQTQRLTAVVNYSLIITSLFWGGKFTPCFFKLDRDPAMINQNQLILQSLDKSGDTGGEGIFLGDNRARHCFVLKDLVPVNFFK